MLIYLDYSIECNFFLFSFDKTNFHIIITVLLHSILLFHTTAMKASFVCCNILGAVYCTSVWDEKFKHMNNK